MSAITSLFAVTEILLLLLPDTLPPKLADVLYFILVTSTFAENAPAGPMAAVALCLSKLSVLDASTVTSPFD